MDVSGIRFENGYMAANVPAYFPCLRKHAGKPFPPVREYCTGDGNYRLYCKLEVDDGWMN